MSRSMRRARASKPKVTKGAESGWESDRRSGGEVWDGGDPNKITDPGMMILKPVSGNRKVFDP
jgi:hypothetical protein